MAQATEVQMNKFVATVDEFFQKYARLISPQTRADVIATGDPALIDDYERAILRGGMLKTSIETTVGAWQAAKREWAKVTDVTSMYIGDAVDWIKNLFGGGPQMNGLGVLQIPAAAFVVAAIGASAALILTMDRIFIAIEASKIQRTTPGISRTAAYQQAKAGAGLDVFGDINKFAVIVGIAFIAYLYFGQKK